MKLAERKFAEPSKISQYLKCSLCIDVYREPLRMSCGHTFCSSCITQWLKQNPTCPTCRSPFEECSNDLIAAGLISEQMVYCTHHPICRWIGQLQNVQAHNKKCDAKELKKLIHVPSSVKHQDTNEDEVAEQQGINDPGDLKFRMYQRLKNNSHHRKEVYGQPDKQNDSIDLLDFIDQIPQDDVDETNEKPQQQTIVQQITETPTQDNQHSPILKQVDNSQSTHSICDVNTNSSDKQSESKHQDEFQLGRQRRQPKHRN